MSPLLASTIIIAGGNFIGPTSCRLPLAATAAVLSVLLLAIPTKSSPPPNNFTWWWGPALFLAVTGLFVGYQQWRFLDTDNWIHEPLIGGYTLGTFPPVHPFFPEASMNGHYGRDLLIACLTPHGSDPLTVVWVLNPLLALSSALLLIVLLSKHSLGRWGTLLGSVFAFFGICVGFRVGLADTTDGNNGVAYALLILLIYLMLEVLELPKRESRKYAWGLYLISGFVLGIYQLVYETHFGLLLLVAASLLPRALHQSDKRKRLMVGVVLTAGLALGLASFEGGPITDLVRSRAIGSQAHEGTDDDQVSDLNVEQHVSIKFPKKELFKVRATSADYQRISVGFRSGPWASSLPAIEGEGYLSIFSPKFLVTHWLPLFLCPLSLWWAWRRRNDATLAFWLFGFWSYLVPGLVDFGPVYEWEYFRWEFAAGFGWATALGICLGESIKAPTGLPRPLSKDEETGWTLRLSQGHLPSLAILAVIGLGLLPAEKLLNRAIIDVQKKGLPGPKSPSSWRLQQPDLGLSPSDLEIFQRLAQEIQQGESVLSNLGEETPKGLWPDCILATLTGAHISGRARPPVDRRVHAHPNYHRSIPWKAALASGSLDPILATKVDWVILDSSDTSWVKVLESSPHATLSTEISGSEPRQLWKLDHKSWKPGPLKASMSLAERTPEWRSATVYRLPLEKVEVQQAGRLEILVQDQDKRASYPPVEYLLSPSNTSTLHFVSPLEEGKFWVAGRSAGSELFRFPLTIDFQKRLSQLQAFIEVPDGVPAKSHCQVKVRLRSDRPIYSSQELELLLRFRREGGDYVWEMDRLPFPLGLELGEGGSKETRLNFVAPWEPGVYLLEMELWNRKSGLRVALSQDQKARLRVTKP